LARGDVLRSGAYRRERFQSFEEAFLRDRPASQPELPIEEALQTLLVVAGRLHADEMTVQAARREGFGYAYEVYYFHEGRFRSLTDVLYMVGEFQFDDEGKLTGATLAEPFMSYRDLGDAILVITRYHEKNHTVFDVITPLNHLSRARLDEISRPLAARESGMTALTEYGCLVARIASPSLDAALGKPTVVSVPIRLGSAHSPIRVSEEKDAQGSVVATFGFNVEALEWIHHTVADDAQTGDTVTLH
jgi:hypothetical protein